MPREIPSIRQTSSKLEENSVRPSKEKIVKAITKLKSGKAAEPDNRPREEFKADPHTTADTLCELFGKIWLEEKKMPTEWNESYIINLPKKGDIIIKK